MIEQIIKHYPDFPKKGIDFIDVLPSLQNKEAFQQAVAKIGSFCTAPNIVTFEARGFLFAAPLLVACDQVKAIVPCRKKGKLPYEKDDLVRVEILKEYGSDELFYRPSDFAACEANGDYIDVTIFDDLLATGGTVKGTADSLLQQTVGGKKIRIKEFVFLVELPALKGRQIIEDIAPVHSLLSLEGVE